MSYQRMTALKWSVVAISYALITGALLGLAFVAWDQGQTDMAWIRLVGALVSGYLLVRFALQTWRRL